MRIVNSIIAGSLWLPLVPLASSAEVSDFAIPAQTAVVMENYCFSCHDDDTQKGEIRLDQLGELSLVPRLELLNRMQEQLFLGEMPPKKKKKQPSAAEHELLAGWVKSELRKHGASKLEDKLRYPSYGNYVDHEALFGGGIEEKAFTPARRWLVSPQIFNGRVAEVFKDQGRNTRFYGVTNPIVLPDHSGIRYYDNTALDGGHLLVMLTNAEWIASKQIRPARVKNGEIGAGEFANPKDRWSPRSTPQAIEAIVLKGASPTDNEIVAAVQAQFDCVLRRPADEAELAEYVELTRQAIELGGNTEGLRQMLVAVLLESEFLYRLEFGAGEADAHGRKKLSPREASYAIAYAISDHSPDTALVAAAEEGRLQTKEDYRREVLRLLDDKQSFYAEGAPELSGKNLRSHKVSHPKINRFFREFFGYPNMVKVFKDTPRSGGFYSNAGRGTAGTSGFVTNEADKIVDHVLKAGKDVFKQLLTTDRYFVYHIQSNEQGAKIIEGWRKVYEALKDSDWRNDPYEVGMRHEALIWEHLKIKPAKEDGPARGHSNTLTRYMEYFEHTFGRGLTPFTRLFWSHGFSHRHSEIYSLPPAAGTRGGYREKDSWDYQVKQPFKINNRKGLLSHPSWLVAHSQNAATDPVKRGRWIREKLLAGRVPDVPITVDAQVPEDPHKTLRERLDMVTGAEQCWKCHVQMNPLGLPFESFDDFGRYRSEEELEHADNLLTRGNGKNNADTFKTKPVDVRGVLDGTGDPALDGEVKNAFDLIDKLAKSERVRQSIIRHAFRYFMGRNEMLSDSQTLIDADKAYLDSGGSFKAVVVSLLTSDSFMYRKEI